MSEKLILCLSIFLIGAGPDRNLCSWWFKYLDEVTQWETELRKAEDEQDWAKAEEISQIIWKLQSRAALENDE